MVSGAILQFPVCKCGSQILHPFTSYTATKTASNRHVNNGTKQIALGLHRRPTEYLPLHAFEAFLA